MFLRISYLAFPTPGPYRILEVLGEVDPGYVPLRSHGSKFSNACRRSGILDQGSISTTR